MSATSTMNSVTKAAKGGTKAYPDEYARSARAVLQRFVDEQGGQRQAAAILDFDQSRLSRLLAANATTQPPLSLLLELRKHVSMTIDQILGLPTIKLDGVSLTELRDRMDAIQALLEAQAVTDGVERLPHRRGRKQ